MSFFDLDFWVGVGIVAGIYGIFALGLQLNVGFTGLINLGQAGFMCVGAYAMGMLVVDAGWPLGLVPAGGNVSALLAASSTYSAWAAVAIVNGSAYAVQRSAAGAEAPR